LRARKEHTMRAILARDPVGILSLAAAAVAVSSCQTLETNFDYDRAADFSGYRTFAWIEEDPVIHVDPEVSPLTVDRVKESIVATLEMQGFSLVEDRSAADFVVGFSVGSREKVDVDAYPRTYAGPYGWVGYDELSVHEYTQGQIAVDVFDAETREPVWHGWATKTIDDSDRENPEPVIREAVQSVLANFPPPPTTG
jgi:hypothetical protein